ncbi:phage/plasmid primase, P4 family [Mycobacterium heckeshornense]|uniref:SF3 helicase domain-containing protein n=1 Tax=Mycobacterium heckeshornense TaxID=110505 RepID=A0A7R7JG15_9MYCO|nr:phage/plasmid primase, P4 family [Mycobacterium heckeshornense]BCO36017.1 hypothetical protein MHEC_24500 [Mycobacterium heckeshornense]
MNDSETPHVITFDDVEASLQLRDFEYRKLTRAKRLIAQCPACLDGGGSDALTLTVLSRSGYVALHCDNGCVPLEVVDALKLDGLLRAPRSRDDLAAQHGRQVRIAYLFAEQSSGKAIHAHGLGWFYWSGRRWVEDGGDKRVREYVLRTLRAALNDSLGDPELRKAVAGCETANGIDGVLRIAAALPEFRVEVEELDSDPHLLNCANGTLDLRELALRSHNPDDLLTQITEASYDDTAAGATWEAFLEEVLPNDDVREYPRRVVGMALLGRVEQHILPILTGVGANGKSTLIAAVLYALGSYAMTADPHLFTAGQTSSIGQVDLRGRRIAVVSETDKGAKLAEETVKRLTGGDRIKARKLYQYWVDFDPSHTVFMVTNHPPQVTGDDEALWRRLRVIRFDVVVAARASRRRPGRQAQARRRGDPRVGGARARRLSDRGPG